MFIKNERFARGHRVVVVQGGNVVVPPFVLLVWASLTRPNLPACPAQASRFPVAIDTGFAGNLLLREQHAASWAGLVITRSVSGAPWQGTVADASGYLLQRVRDCTYQGVGGAVDCVAFEADLWLHSKETGGQSMRLELLGGFAFPPSPAAGAPAGSSLPLLGGLALYVNDMKLVVDDKNLDFSLGEQV